MHVTSQSFEYGQPIPARFAFGIPDPAQHVALSDNRNPHLAWSEVPDGCESFVITVIDEDVPTRPDDVNQSDREVPATLARCEFVHWLICDIPASVREVGEGAFAAGVEPKGRVKLSGPPGARQGQNDYTGWFAQDPDMAGIWRGYDGPCPPWNDSLIHHYHHTVHALSVPSLELADGFTLTQLRAAMEGKVLASATWIGTYTLNPRLSASA